MSIEPTATPSDMPTLSRETFWQQHIMQWRSSGLSKMAYCEQFSLVYHQMVYWSKKLEDEPEQQSETGRFVPVRVPHTIDRSVLRLCLPNGLIIEGIDDHNVELVGPLMRQL